MANVQIDTPGASLSEGAQMLQDIPHEAASEVRTRIVKQRKKIARCSPVQYPSKPAMLDDRLCLRTEMTKVDKTDTIDAGRMAAFPSTPDEARHIEQERGVVRHSEGATKTVTRASHLHRAVPFTGTATTVNGLCGRSNKFVPDE
jgi:hypothetical protein